MKRILSSFVLIAGCILQMATTVCAQESVAEPVRESGMLQLVVMYSDEENENIPIQGGCGFLIGDAESSPQYIITASEVVAVSEDMEKQLRENFELSEGDKLSLSMKAVVSRDVMVDLQVVAKSEEMDFYVLKLSQPLFDRKPFVLCDDSLVGSAGRGVVSYGYPTALGLGEELVFYVKEDMIEFSGKIVGDDSINEIAYVCHDIEVTQGTLGGPIVNETGEVIAINQNRQVQDGYYALQITEMLSILDALGIPYTTTSELAAERQAILDAMVHKEKLETAIKRVYALESDLYYEKTWLAVEHALETAVVVNDKKEATQAEVDSACENLLVSIELLEKKPPMWMILSIVAGVLVGIVGVVAIVMYITREGRKRRKMEKMAEFTVSQAAPVFEEKKEYRPDYREIVKKEETFENEGIYTDGSGGTILGNIEQGTTVLSQVNKEVDMQPYLIRIRTGEQIMINGAECVLGKEPSQTDYHIKGNPAISRVHAVIMNQAGQYSVADKNATNGTFVNGQKVQPYQRMTLNNGSKQEWRMHPLLTSYGVWTNTLQKNLAMMSKYYKATLPQEKVKRKLKFMW